VGDRNEGSVILDGGGDICDNLYQMIEFGFKGFEDISCDPLLICDGYHAGMTFFVTCYPGL